MEVKGKIVRKFDLQSGVGKASGKNKAEQGVEETGIPN